MGSHYFLCSLFLLSLFVSRENQGKWGERKLRLVVFCFFSMFFFLKNLGGIRMQAGGEEYELKQMRDMAAAKKRWDALIRDGKVKVLTPREAGYAVQLSSKTLLDVRPSTERKKAWIKGSIWIPIFDIDDTFDAGSLPQKVTNFVMGGWWSGVPTLSYNKQFLSKVEEKLPKDTDLIVACQKGLRSLAACELLYNAGYRNLFWVQGGLEAAEEEDLVREGPQPLKFAGIGGLSEFLGWTGQQRAQAAREGWGYRLLYSARLVGVFLAADALIIGAQQVGRYIQDIRSH
ncbi:Rhodanese-like domain-containing protein 11 [Citrus sinensis]|uniref:Rhodanese-like domain-containing protein 11 n=1 Tax=Citrus sinensis TaxID=2711 RepID=A0ACB8LSF5_CITSI|nr:Rhodanese-like domain-containing protein 11 [Citrus sinensis]